MAWELPFCNITPPPCNITPLSYCVDCMNIVIFIPWPEFCQEAVLITPEYSKTKYCTVCILCSLVAAIHGGDVTIYEPSPHAPTPLLTLNSGPCNQHVWNVHVEECPPRLSSVLCPSPILDVLVLYPYCVLYYGVYLLVILHGYLPHSWELQSGKPSLNVGDGGDAQIPDSPDSPPWKETT